MKRARNRCWYTRLAGCLPRGRKAPGQWLRDKAIQGHPVQFDAESSRKILAEPGNSAFRLGAVLGRFRALNILVCEIFSCQDKMRLARWPRLDNAPHGG